jgi:drug/metabolite transporter (DMT)-like permease
MARLIQTARRAPAIKLTFLATHTLECALRQHSVRAIVLSTLAMLAFAGNSILCRLALKFTQIDPASFTSIRVVSGALVLWILLQVQRKNRVTQGNWFSAFLLFVYAAAFSFSYISLTAATGALILFGAVQATMIGASLIQGVRLTRLQLLGFAIALAGLLALLFPNIAAPSFNSALLMLCAGIAWGIYSLRGKGAGDATATTAGNFLRAIPFAIMLSLLHISHWKYDDMGILYAVLSGALTSGIGYAIWYSALPFLSTTKASVIQLTVPMLAALGGILLLGEPLKLIVALASLAILGGVTLVMIHKA